MKLTYLFLFFPFGLFAQHILSPGLSVYHEQVDFIGESSNRLMYKGLEINVRHSIKTLSWVGTDFGISFDKENDLVFHFGTTLRATIYNNFFGLDLILPRLNMPLEGFTLNKYNTPFGASVRVLPGRLKVIYTGLVFMNAIQSRLSIQYNF